MVAKRKGGTWVVYRVAVKGSAQGANAVCDAAEWAAMEAARPSFHTLLRAGIASEAMAEKLARGTSGDTIPRGTPRPAEGPAVVR